MKKWPIPYTCPDINLLIKRLQNIEFEAEAGLKMSEENIDDIKATFQEILNELNGFESILEDLRYSNSSLRDWGENFIEQVYLLEQEVDDLQSQVTDLSV